MDIRDATPALRRALEIPYAEPGMRIGLLGGSFNPPHEGHLAITLLALKRAGLDRRLVAGYAGQSAQGP